MTEMFVSYAQNYEDVYLWRALKQVDSGCYIDVGAYDPTVDSVTRAFYERGWRGINIEPIQACFQKLVDARPNDTNLNLAVGSVEGLVTLYEVPGTGLSTPVYANALRARERGYPFNTVQVPVVTLNTIWQDHSLDVVHFLKIDVEGAEEDVLQGLDLSTHRPWIILIESTIPNSPEENCQSWEPILARGEYLFAMFDGLNRYYVAKEHHHLCAAFAKPPNYFDHCIRAGEFEAKQDAARLRQSERVLHVQLERTEAERNELKRDRDLIVDRMEHLRRDHEALQATLEAIYRSRFWRYTAPLRATRHGLLPMLRAFTNLAREPMRPLVHIVRKGALWAASRPVLRRLAKKVLARLPGVRWRFWRFLLTPPEMAVVVPFTVGSHRAPAQNAGGHADANSKMFVMSEPRQPVDVVALKSRIHREVEHQNRERART